MASLYVTIARELADELRAMKQNGGQRLPSEAELCRQYECSRQTIRSALNVLESKGLIVKRRGSGSFIADQSAGLGREVFVIVPDCSEYIYPSIIRDIRSVLEPRGYTLRCCDTDSRVLREGDALARAEEAQPAGIIIQASNPALCGQSEEILCRLNRLGVPLVYLFDAYDHPDAPCVSPDNFEGAYRLVEHLVSRGHRRIACIMKSDNKSGKERYRGCLQASIDLGLEFDEKQFFWFSSEDRRAILNGNDRVLRAFIADSLRPCTSVVCYNDEIAFYLIVALKAAGLRVPEDIAVVGFDNSYYTRSGEVGITSLGWTPRELGGRAAETLLALVSGRRCSPEPLLWELHERDSVKR